VREGLRETQTVLLPLGSTEQHGYHLPLSTDTHNGQEISRRASEQTGCFVTPCFHFAYSGGELPGTVDCTPETTAVVVKDLITVLGRQGFRNVIVVLGHGGSENEQAVRLAAETVQRRSEDLSGVRVAIFAFWKSAATPARAFAERDYHAGWLETSLMLHWKPELVGDERVVDSPEAVAAQSQEAHKRREAVPHGDVVPRVRQNPAVEIGVWGDPSKASAEIGRQACDESVAALVELIRAMERAA
jgi:creatinine amidohydrolase